MSVEDLLYHITASLQRGGQQHTPSPRYRYFNRKQAVTLRGFDGALAPSGAA